MIRVLMFNKLYHPYIGGVERVVYDLCQELKDKVELKVLAANTKFKTEIEQKDNYKIIRVASLGSVLSSVHLAMTMPRWWKRLESDIVHFHFPSPIAELYCLMLSPPAQPLVVSYHADIVGYNKALFLYTPFLINFLKRANRIIVSSSAILERSPFLSKFKDKCTVIPYGIDIEKFNLTKELQQKVNSLRSQFKGPIVLFVGRLVNYKGIEYLISAMADIDATLLIVGKGPREGKLKDLAKKLKLSNKIYFIGELPDKDLPAYYHACDVFVLPSVNNKEEFGIVQLEAHACSKPVISTNLPTGVPFVNLDGVTGLIVPPRSPDKLAEAINRLLSDTELCQKLGEQARKRIETEFKLSDMAEKVLDVYRKTVHR